jgi:hypothetical protein
MSRMTSETASRHIQSFNKSFGEAHLYFACHAALPIALTPDLLYVLWKNFQHDINGEQLNIPWIAVADLLLSGLCHEVGHELYEIDLPVRNILLNNLQKSQNFGKARINNISNFLLEYIKPQLYSTNQDTQDLARTQRLTALAYLNPEQTAREIAIVFAKTNSKDETELLRITSLLETLAEPLSEYKELLSYSRAIANFLRGKIEEATIQFLELIEGKSKITAFGATLPIPERIKTNLSTIETPHNKSLPVIGGGFSALIITMLGSFGLQHLQRNFLPPDAIPTNPPKLEVTINNPPTPINATPSITAVPTPIITNSPSSPFLIPSPIISQNPLPNPTISPSQENSTVITPTPQLNNTTPTVKPTAEPIITSSPSPNNIIPTPTTTPQPNITNSPLPDSSVTTPTVTPSPINTTQPDAQNSLITKGEIYNVVGDVTITRNNQTPQSAKEGDLLFPGDMVRTGKRSRFDTLFNEGSVLRVGSQSAFKFKKGLTRVQLKNAEIAANFSTQIQPTPTPTNTENSFPSDVQQIALIRGWRCSANQDTLQLEFYLSATSLQNVANPQPKYFQLAQPPRLVIDFPNTDLGPNITQENNCDKIQRGKFSLLNSQITRFVFDMNSQINMNQVQFQASSSNSSGWVLRLSFGIN